VWGGERGRGLGSRWYFLNDDCGSKRIRKFQQSINKISNHPNCDWLPQPINFITFPFKIPNRKKSSGV
jgi:hypothetical protein